ncbi:glycoside hydrolase family 5 protein [Aquabacterium sp. OR-4]|uniref:glycoside hydrolase family 5 protein n=1 Tax=Aquabacterium sp. OR-4 TaxID=2978127 RepID=UPI0021B40312|nr:glycoside hydrolase family 5 protein [Aquabacterium sp. OR-4]MDT7838361.1 glycoside hydrolase family 5 protein [Aquabacterium sp. OR-4]
MSDPMPHHPPPSSPAPLSRRQLLQALAATPAAAGLAAWAADGGPATAPAPAPAPASQPPMRDAATLAAVLSPGWNLGNALEAIGGETAWGNARTTPALLQAVAAAGFRFVRLPVAWKQHADAGDRIRADWLARVAEVVAQARQAGLMVMVNTHWDGGWLQPTRAAEAGARARLASFWTQIATHLRDHDDGLLFAGTNEVMKEHDWSPPTSEYVAVQNGYNQLFVDTVRATGGRNASRVLVVQGYNTDIGHTLRHFRVPRDSTPGRLMLEVHYYDPYKFTIDEASPLWQWGATATDRQAKDSWGDEAWVDAQFDKMKSRYADAGLPVMIGEYGVIAKPAIAGAEAFREAWNAHVTRAARRRGFVPVYWDNGVTGNKGMGLFDRASGRVAHPGLLKAIVEAGR